MKNQARTNQGGSVVTFLVVGVVLVLATLGAIYFVQQRSSDNGQPAPVTTSPAPSEDAKQPSGSPSASPSSSPRPSSSPSSSPAPGSVPPTGYNLPATGPADDLVSLALPIALLTGSAVAYMRSRGFRFNSFLR